MLNKSMGRVNNSVTNRFVQLVLMCLYCFCCHSDRIYCLFEYYSMCVVPALLVIIL